MKRNFLVTTGLIDTWEFYENNFVLGKWCEFYETNDYDEEKYKDKIPKEISIIKNSHHWNDNEKRNKDYEYLKEKLEYLLETISEKLSIIHNVNESKEYWRIIIYYWLAEYVSVIFDRWESVRIFFEKNNNKRFYSNFISLNSLDYLPKNHMNFCKFVQSHEWNHLIFLRLFNFLNIKNLFLIKIKREEVINNPKKHKISDFLNFSLMTHVLKLIDKITSKLAFKFNKIIFESFFFPNREYFKICSRFKLIPSKYSNFFDFDVKEKSLSMEEKRIKFMNLLSEIKNQDKFIQFLLLNFHKDIPKSYLENFNTIKKFFLPHAKKKKIIFSATSFYRNDNFKIYVAETRKVGSKYIHTKHGGGLTIPKNDQFFSLLSKVPDKVIKWHETEKNNLIVNLSPTLPTIKLKNQKKGNDCSIIFVEQPKYINKFPETLVLDQSIDFFNELVQFVNKLDPAIKSKVKYRCKDSMFRGFNSIKKFSKFFGERYIDKISIKNTFKNTILNSKLIVVTYPETSFSEAMHSNIPTIVIIKKNYYQFTEASLHIFNVLKKNKIAFDDFNEAKIHINKHWKDLDLWWESKNVQSARKSYLKSFFNVKSDWYKEWSDFIYSTSFGA